MKENHQHIEDIFKEAFSHHEMDVSAKVWDGVQSSLAANTAITMTTTATTGLTKLAAIVGLGTIIGVGAVNEAIYINSHHSSAPHYISVDEVITVKTENENAVVSAEIVEQNTVTVNDLSEISEKKAQVQTPQKSSISQTAESDQDQLPVVAYRSNESVTTSASTTSAIEENNASNDIETSSASAVNNTEKETVSSDTEPKEEAKVECLIHLKHSGKTYISANGDGTQDEFKLDNSDNIDPKSFTVIIRNIQGQILFTSKDVNFQWDGKVSGELLPNRTVCYYEIMARDINGIKYTARNAKGSITVVY